MNGIDEKTKEQILEETAEYDMREGSVIYVQEEVFEAMQAYADQEKRSTAIAFHIWFEINKWEKAILNPHVGEYFSGNYDGFYTIDQLYDLYINSLPK